MLCEQTSEYMLLHNRCIFHAAALSCDGLAWLLTAGSGVGKSTLCRSLTERYKEEISIINGDKPVLWADKERLMVYPSPWNGKEGWHGADAAPLGGIVLLQRGTETTMKEATSREAASNIFLNIFQSYCDETVIRASGSITERMIQSVPVWMLTENNIQEATELLYQTIKEAQGYGL